MKRKADQVASLLPAKKAKTTHGLKPTGSAPIVELCKVAVTIEDCWDCLGKEKKFHLDPALDSLKLDGDVFDVRQARILEHAIASTSSLIEVTFSGAYLGAKGLPGIIKSLRKQLNLHTLDLYGNNIRDEGAKLLFSFLKENKTLAHLNLGANGLTLNDDWVIDPIVTSNLKTLYLHENNINEGEAYIAKALAASTSLEELYLGHNKFESAVMISGALATNKSLKVLSLSGIKLLDFGVKHLIAAIQKSESLVGIDLNEAQIGYEGVISLMSILKNKNLRFIRITGNLVSQEIIDAFHDILTQRRKLQEINEGTDEETAQLDKRLHEAWMIPAEAENSGSVVEEVENDAQPEVSIDENQPMNNTNQQNEPKAEGTDDNTVDYTELEVFSLDDWWDKEEAVNFVEKYPEISLGKVVPEPFGLQDMDFLYKSFHTVLGQSLKKINEKVQQDCDEAMNLAGPIEQMQQTRRNLELERTLLNQKIEKLDKEFKKKAEGLLFKLAKAVKLSDRRAEALKNFENAETLKVTSSNEFEHWKEKLKQNITTWDVNDVVSFLDEIWIRNVNCATAFRENDINGAVLLNLTTDELMHDLKMTFHQAKRLQLYILIQKSGGDIYSDLPPVLNWENADVCQWLRENNLEAHEEAFIKKKITGIELHLLDKFDLATAVQIAALGDRSQIMLAVEALRRENNPFGAADKMPAVETAVRVSPRKKPPSALICPITKKLMTDPVQANDGHTYERSAIEAWFKKSKLSPVTNKPLRSVKVIPSHALKAMLEEYNKNK